MQASTLTPEPFLELGTHRFVVVGASPETIQPRILQLLAHLAVRGEHIGVVIAHNQFDLFELGAAVKQFGGDRETALAHVHLLRAETCAQLYGCVQRYACAPRFPILFLLGFLEPFADEDIRFARAEWLLLATLRQLKALAAQGISVLITLSPPSTRRCERFAELVQNAADVTLALESPRLMPPQQTRLEL